MQYILILIICTVQLSWTQLITTNAKAAPVCINGDRLSPAKNDGCNKCICSEEQWFCTHFKCPSVNPPPVCKDGDRKSPAQNDGCNKCLCIGEQWACTTFKCPTVATSTSTAATTTTTKASPSPEPMCNEGDRKSPAENDGCNKCICSEARQWVCTEFKCPVSTSTATTTTTKAAPVCINGDRLSPAKNDGCNKCICSEEQWFCTHFKCPSVNPPPICKDGDRKSPAENDGCNKCLCIGEQWACTTFKCPTVSTSTATTRTTEASPSPEPMCKEGDRKSPAENDGCNKCICSAAGQWVCTPFKCPVSSSTATTMTTASPEPICKDEDRLSPAEYDGCNKCICKGEQWACTSFKCPAKMAKMTAKMSNEGATDEFAVCKEGDKKTAKENDGCNECFCLEEQWACTELYCEPVTTTTTEITTEEYPKCKEGDKKSPKENDGCNGCFCLDGHWACTKMYCIPVEVTTEETNEDNYDVMDVTDYYPFEVPLCIDGDILQPYEVDGCNTCYCESGLWECTTMKCSVLGPIFEDYEDTTQGSCKYGDTKKSDDGCNHCMCEYGMWICTASACTPLNFK